MQVLYVIVLYGVGFFCSETTSIAALIDTLYIIRDAMTRSSLRREGRHYK